MVHRGEDFAGMKWPKCRQDKQYMHVGMWQLETWVCGGLGGAVDLMILESFLQLKWFCDSASEFNWWSWSVDKTAEWDKTVFFCPLMFYEVNILYPLTWMAELLYNSTYLTALWWEHQADLYHQFSSGPLIIKWDWLSLRIAWEKHVLKLVSEGKCHLSGSEVFVDLYGFWLICTLKKTSLSCLSVLQGKNWWRLFGN